MGTAQPSVGNMILNEARSCAIYPPCDEGLTTAISLAIAAILLGVAVICGIFYIYDVSRQTVQDNARAEAHLSSQQSANP
jgi:hypothetical protein